MEKPTPLHLRMQRPGEPVRHDATYRLLMLGFAGGSVTSLLPLAGAFPDDVDVWGVEYPGHGVQWQRPLHRGMQPMIRDLMVSVEALGDMPLVLLGYSMGAHLAHRITLARPDLVRGLVIISARPPQDPELSHTTRDASDDELTARLKALGGLPDGVLSHPGLMSLFMPVMRADLSICAELGYSGILAARQPLSCPVMALQGDSDPICTGTGMHPWLGLSASGYRNAFRSYDAGHFLHVGREPRIAADVDGWIRGSVLPAGHHAMKSPVQSCYPFPP